MVSGSEYIVIGLEPMTLGSEQTYIADVLLRPHRDT